MKLSNIKSKLAILKTEEKESYISKILESEHISMQFFKSDKPQHNLKYYAPIKEKSKFIFFKHSVLFILDVSIKNVLKL